MNWKKFVIHFVATLLGISAKIGGEPVGRPQKELTDGGDATNQPHY